VIVVVIVTGGKQSQLQVFRLGLGLGVCQKREEISVLTVDTSSLIRFWKIHFFIRASNRPENPKKDSKLNLYTYRIGHVKLITFQS
jgi:hypothetical protein